MKFNKVRAFGLGAVAFVGGCAPMAQVEPVEKSAEQALLVGEPFVHQLTGEPLNVDEPLSSTLTLEHALRLSLKHDAEIQAALARVRQAESDARQTRLLPNPVLAVSFRFPEAGGKGLIDADLSAELLALLTRPGRISAVDHRLRKESSEALKTVLDVALEVQRKYADAQALDARVNIAESRRSILQGLLEITQSRLRAGEAVRLDVLTAQSELSALDGELVTLRADRRLARLTLARLTGRPSAQAEWTLPPWSPEPEPKLAEGEWIQLALEHRPELAAFRWEIAALGHEVRIARLDTILSGGAGVAAERDDLWSIGPSASLPIPIFDTGAVAKRRRMDQLIEQQHELTQKGRLVIEEVRSALEQLAAARAGLDRVRNELVPLQEQRLKQSQDAYRAGLTNIITLRIAEQDLQQARALIIELQHKVSQARFDLDRAVGGSGVYLKSIATNSTRPIADGVTK